MTEAKKMADLFSAESANEASPDCKATTGVGRYPTRLATVRAGVLAHLIEGYRFGSLAAISAASTTRLAAVVHVLGDTVGGQYGWRIEREDIAVDTNDGRVAWVTEYWLSPEVIALARANDGDEFCEAVRRERAGVRAAAPARQRRGRLLRYATTPMSIGAMQ